MQLPRNLPPAQLRLLNDAAAALSVGVSGAGGAGGAGGAARYLVPGRIEVLGKHTDYCGGRSLVCATEQGLCVAARALAEPVLRIHALSLGATADLPLDAETNEGEPWAAYPRAVARRLSRNFGPNLHGVELAIASDLPQAAGMSSSSAMIVACFLALADRNHLRDHPLYRRHLATPELLAHYLGCIENGSAFGPLAGESGVGTSGGSQDHTAILCARPGRLSQFAFCPVRHRGDIELDESLVFVLGVSGVIAEKTRAAREAYNAVSERARTILSHFNQRAGARAATLAEAAATPERLWEVTEASLRPRLRQFLAESGRIIPAAVAALADEDLETFGRLVDESQREAETGLENQVPETVHLARSARRLGAHAASAFGAGFGGSVWALVGADAAEAFRDRWASDYAAAFPERTGTFLLTRPGPPARRIG